MVGSTFVEGHKALWLFSATLDTGTLGRTILHTRAFTAYGYGYGWGGWLNDPPTLSNKQLIFGEINLAIPWWAPYWVVHIPPLPPILTVDNTKQKNKSRGTLRWWRACVVAWTLQSSRGKNGVLVFRPVTLCCLYIQHVISPSQNKSRVN